MVNRTSLTQQWDMFTNEGKFKNKKQHLSDFNGNNTKCLGDCSGGSRHRKRHLPHRNKSMVLPNMKHHVDYLRSQNDLVQGQVLTQIPAAPLRPTPQPKSATRRSVLWEGESKMLLQKQFVTQNAALLSIACLGALLLMSVNLVGIVCCKGYFKKKAKPIPVVATYPRRHTSFLSRRHFANLPKYSLEGNIEAASVIDEIRERNIRDDPILGKYPNCTDVGHNRPVTVSCGTIYGLRQPPNIEVNSSGIEMAELNTFGVNIEELDDVGRSRIVNGGRSTTWKDKLRKFHFRKKSFREKTEKANTTGYFC